MKTLFDKNLFLAEAKEIIANGADVNARDSYERTPLFYAVKYNLKIIRLLLNNGADVNAIDKKGNIALLFAPNRTTALYLIKRGANIHHRYENKDTLLTCGGLCPEVAIVVIEHGIDVTIKNVYGDTALHKATDARVVELLIEQGADVNAINMCGRTPLHRVNGNVEIAELLLDNGAYVNIKDDSECTPLHYVEGNVEIAELLLDNDADVDAKDYFGRTVFHLIYDSIELAKLLVDRKADINARTIKGWTPLYYARLYKQTKLVDYLISKGAIE